MLPLVSFNLVLHLREGGYVLFPCGQFSAPDPLQLVYPFLELLHGVRKVTILGNLCRFVNPRL